MYTQFSRKLAKALSWKDHTKTNHIWLEFSLRLKWKYAPPHLPFPIVQFLTLHCSPLSRRQTADLSIGILTHRPLHLFLLQGLNWIIIVRPVILSSCNYMANMLGQSLQRRWSTRNYCVSVMADKGWTGAVRRIVLPSILPQVYTFPETATVGLGNIIDKGWRFLRQFVRP